MKCPAWAHRLVREGLGPPHNTSRTKNVLSTEARCKWPSVVGRMMAPREGQVLIAGTCECAILERRTLQQGSYPGLFG